MLLALLLQACTPPDGDTADRSAVRAPVETRAAYARADNDGLEAVAPTACPEPIYVAQTGWSAEEPVLADPHAELYGAAPNPYHVHIGWSGDPSTSAALIWRTDADTFATQLQIGPDRELGTTIVGASFPLSTDPVDGRVHEARVCGLPPGTTWHYRVGGPGGWSDIHTFTTAPPPGSTEPIVFGVAGDTRGGTSVWSQILAAMKREGVEFVLFTGDAVAIGSNVAQWNDWYDAGEGYLESLPVLLSHGNHEGLAQAHFALTALPGNEQWFSFDYGDAHLVAFNDTPGSSSHWGDQAAWMAEDLAATPRTWKMTFHHKPPYSGVAGRGEEMNVITYFVPVFEAAGVQVDFAGHNHNYERTVPMRGGVEVPQAEGVTYLVTAGGGAPLYDNLGEKPYLAVYHETQHYVIGRIEGGTMTLTTYDMAGNVLDTLSLVP